MAKSDKKKEVPDPDIEIRDVVTEKSPNKKRRKFLTQILKWGMS